MCDLSNGIVANLQNLIFEKKLRLSNIEDVMQTLMWYIQSNNSIQYSLEFQISEGIDSIQSYSLFNKTYEKLENDHRDLKNELDTLLKNIKNITM